MATARLERYAMMLKARATSRAICAAASYGRLRLCCVIHLCASLQVSELLSLAQANARNGDGPGDDSKQQLGSSGSSSP